MKSIKTIVFEILDADIKQNQQCIKDIKKLKKEKPLLADYDAMMDNHLDIIHAIEAIKMEVKKKVKDERGIDKNKS